MNARFQSVIHRQAHALHSPSETGHYTGHDWPHGLFMTTGSRRYPQTYAQPMKAVDALISALRSPVHASPKLRPIADELEGCRDRS